jgi:pimeloyl-[acyl-carrier protein] methyl ester esterase
MRYTRCGIGRPIVFIHGWCLSGKLWTYAEERFCSHHEVIIPDLPGFGTSGSLPGPYSIERLSTDLGTLLDDLKLSNVVLVGFALGAAVAMTLAARPHPRLASIVNVGVPLASASPYQRMPKSMRRDWPDFARRSAHALFHKPPSEATLLWIERMFGDTSLSVGIEAVDELARLDAEQLAKKISIPQLFIHATEDSVAPLAFGQRCAQVASQGELQTVQGSGHLIVIDGKDAFHEILSAHLNGRLPNGGKSV